MKKQAQNPVNRRPSESEETASEPTGAVSGEFVTETLAIFVAFGLYCAPVPAFRPYSYLNATIGSTCEAR
jgi:hypothetical protein